MVVRRPFSDTPWSLFGAVTKILQDLRFFTFLKALTRKVLFGFPVIFPFYFTYTKKKGR